eukprot:m.122468 g.122468  ORF g.122468 m.122468 type:complete len:139 (-) comp28923_c2_seq1:419-835(-)
MSAKIPPLPTKSKKTLKPTMDSFPNKDKPKHKNKNKKKTKLSQTPNESGSSEPTSATVTLADQDHSTKKKKKKKKSETHHWMSTQTTLGTVLRATVGLHHPRQSETIFTHKSTYRMRTKQRFPLWTLLLQCQFSPSNF